MNLVKTKSLGIPKMLLTVSFLSTANFATAQMNRSTEALVNRLQNNGYIYEFDPATGDVFVPNQINLQFREGTTAQWKQAFIQNLQTNLSEALGIEITMRLVKKCNCETLESWELLTPSGTLSARGDKDKITTTSIRTSNSTLGGDNLLKIGLNYYQMAREEATLNPNNNNNTPLNSMISGISLNQPKDIKILIIDTGIDPTHPNPDFRNAIWNDASEGTDLTTDLNGNCQGGDRIGYNFVEDNNLPLDGHSHGTHVAGIVAKNASCISPKLLIAKALDDKGIGLDIDIACAIYYGIKQKVDVINMSFGRTGTSSTIIEQGVQTAVSNNIVVVAAAGNFLLDNDVIPMWPANYPNVLSVNSYKSNEPHLLWQSTLNSDLGSNVGAETVHLAGDGESIYSTIPGGYSRKSGTSMAAPQVAAAAAILKDRNHNWSEQDIRNNISRNAILAEYYNMNGFNQYGVLSNSQYCNTPFPEEEKADAILSKHVKNSPNSHLSIAPNPVQNTSLLTIEYDGNETIGELMLSSTDGKVVFQNKISITGKITQESLPIEGLPNGIYIVKIVLGKIVLSKRFVKF